MESSKVDVQDIVALLSQSIQTSSVRIKYLIFQFTHYKMWYIVIILSYPWMFST